MTEFHSGDKECIIDDFMYIINSTFSYHYSLKKVEKKNKEDPGRIFRKIKRDALAFNMLHDNATNLRSKHTSLKHHFTLQ